MKFIHFADEYLNFDFVNRLLIVNGRSYYIHVEIHRGGHFTETYENKDKRDERYLALLKELNISTICNEVWNV
jgi:hypothetical protein